MHNETAKDMLERRALEARAVDSGTILLSPATFVRVLVETGGELVRYWQPTPGGPYVPTFTTKDGNVWPITVSEELEPRRQFKTLSGLTRGMVAR